MFEVYDVDDFSQNASLTKHDYVGSAVFNLHEIIGSPTKYSKKILQNKKTRRINNGNIIVYGEEVSGIQHLIALKPNLKLQSKHDNLIFFKIYRSQEEILIPVYQSEVKKTAKRSVEFKDLKISLCSLCRGDYERQIVFKLFQYANNGKHKLLGTFHTATSKLVQKSKQFVYSFQNKNEKIVAEFDLGDVKLEQKYSFLDYVHGDCEISLLLALDFTRSNGKYEEKGSLHYLDKYHPNDYMQAIKSVGEILQYYDSNNKIPVYGFGAKILPFDEITSHCFALNGNIFDPETDGIQEVLAIYEKAVQNLQFHGPTFFSQIIRMAADYANNQESTQEDQKYSILLIITDGIINDTENTINEIVRGSSFPLSIIIVGVGNEDFTLMQELDADITPLFSKYYGKQMDRDIVQFVPFNQFKDDNMLLACEVLEEIPRQVLSYFQSKGIKPKQTPKPKLNSAPSQNFCKKSQLRKTKSIKNSQFLEETKKKFKQILQHENFKDKEINELLNQGIPAVDLDLAISIIQTSQIPLITQINNKQISIKEQQIKRISSSKNNQVQPKGILKKRHSIQVIKTVEFEDQNYCKICYANQIDIVLLECGHRIFCSKCVSRCNKICPNCRAHITRWIKTFNA